jgi:hypothetical protein
VTHNVISEEEFFDANEFVDYDDLVDDLMDNLHPESVSASYEFNLTNIAKVKPSFALLFGWAPTETIQQASDVTTQYVCGRMSDTLKQHWSSRFPACNVKQQNKPVATGTVLCNTPTVDSGVTAAEIFVGRELLVADVYGLKTDKEFVNT